MFPAVYSNTLTKKHKGRDALGNICEEERAILVNRNTALDCEEDLCVSVQGPALLSCKLGYLYSCTLNIRYNRAAISFSVKAYELWNWYWTVAAADGVRRARVR